MSQRIADASAKVARSSYPLPRRLTTSFRPLWDNWPSFLERLSAYGGTQRHFPAVPKFGRYWHTTDLSNCSKSCRPDLPHRG